MSQTCNNLFDSLPDPPSRAKKSDPITSHIAAKKADESGRTKKRREQALAFVRQHPGMTAMEIGSAMGVQYLHPARALSVLRQMGFVEGKNERKCKIGGNLSLTWWPVPIDKITPMLPTRISLDMELFNEILAHIDEDSDLYDRLITIQRKIMERIKAI